jgi:hypothetical protein
MRTHVHSTCTHTGTRTLKLTLKHTYTHVHTHMHTHMHTHTHVCVQGVARRLAGAQTSRARYPARIIPALLPQPAEPGGEWLTSSFVFCRSCGSPFLLCFSLLWRTICFVFCRSCGSPSVLCPVCFAAPGFDTCHTNDSAVKC